MIAGVHDLGAYLAGAAAITLLPGPNSMLVLTLSARAGARPALRAALGVLLGDTVLMALAAGGVATLLRSQPALYSATRYAGAAYLSYLGLTMVRASWRRWNATGNSTGDDSVQACNSSPKDVVDSRSGSSTTCSRSEMDSAPDNLVSRRTHIVRDARNGDGGETGVHHFRRALTVSLLNPKMILFFLSFFVQFIDPGYAYRALSVALLSAIIQTFSAVYLGVLVLGGALLARRFAGRRRLTAGLTFGAGALFIAFGAGLATGGLG